MPLATGSRLGLAALVLGCATTALTTTALNTTALATPKTTPKPPPQYLPLDAQWCLGSTGCIQLEVARTPLQQQWGLQLRPPLQRLRGMLFPFQPAQPVKFWMHRTPEPLDMVFVRSGQVIAIEARVPPCMHLPCRSYGPDGLVDGVIELGTGQAEALGITLGRAVRIEPLGAQSH